MRCGLADELLPELIQIGRYDADADPAEAAPGYYWHSDRTVNRAEMEVRWACTVAVRWCTSSVASASSR